jgi:hypothetical protein
LILRALEILLRFENHQLKGNTHRYFSRGLFCCSWDRRKVGDILGNGLFAMALVHWNKQYRYICLINLISALP